MPDWSLPENLELLRQAYPDGYLAARGVLTLGRWQVMEVVRTDNVVSDVAFFGPNGEDQGLAWPGPALRAALEKGDLLPRLDPADRATWACALQDLDPRAVALRRIPAPHGPAWELWTRHDDGQLYAKRLFYDDNLRQTFDTEDVAIALVTARIQRWKETTDGPAKV
jgi:hypothetical protein